MDKGYPPQTLSELEKEKSEQLEILERATKAAEDLVAKRNNTLNNKAPKEEPVDEIKRKNKENNEVNQKKKDEKTYTPDITHLDTVNARLEEVKQRQVELRDTAEAIRGSYNVDMIKQENDELKKEEDSLLMEVQKIKEEEEKEKSTKEENLHRQTILKEQLIRRGRVIARLKAVKQRQDELLKLVDFSRGSYNVDMTRQENDELKKEEASLEKELNKINAEFPELDKMTIEEANRKTINENETKEDEEFMVAENNEEEAEEKNYSPELLEKQQNLEYTRNTYIYEHKKWKKESDKEILIDKTRNVVFNTLTGVRNIFSKNKIEYKKKINKDEYKTEKAEMAKREYMKARIDMGNAMYESEKARLIKIGFTEEEIAKGLTLYKAEKILKKVIIEERQKIIDAKDKPKALEKLYRGYMNIKPRWKKVALSTLLFLPLSATGAFGASAIAAGGIYAGVAGLAAVRFSASMAIGAVVAKSVKTIDWARRGSDLKFEKEKYRERAHAKDEFTKSEGEINFEQMEKYEGRVDKIKKEEKKRARNRMILKAGVGGAIAMISGYVAYDAMGNGISEIKGTHSGETLTINKGVPEVKNSIQKTEEVDIGDIDEDVTIGEETTNVDTIKPETGEQSGDTSNGRENMSAKEYIAKTTQENKIELGKVDTIYNKSIETIFPNNETDHMWDNIKDKKIEDLFRLEKEGSLNEEYRPLATYLHRIEANTNLQPENGETVSGYMDRGIGKAYLDGKIDESHTGVSIEDKTNGPITAEEILKITGAKGLHIGDMKDLKGVIEAYEENGYKVIPGQPPVEMKFNDAMLKGTKVVVMENKGMTQSAATITSNIRMNNVMELLSGEGSYDYYLEKITSDKGVKLVHIKFYK